MVGVLGHQNGEHPNFANPFGLSVVYNRCGTDQSANLENQTALDLKGSFRNGWLLQHLSSSQCLWTLGCLFPHKTQASPFLWRLMPAEIIQKASLVTLNCHRGTRPDSRVHLLPLISRTSGSRSGRSSSQTGRSWVFLACIHLRRRGQSRPCVLLHA